MNDIPQFAHYEVEDVKELVFQLDAYTRYANKLERYITSLAEAMTAAGIAIPEEVKGATQEGQQSKDNIRQYPHRGQGRQTSETSSSDSLTKSGEE